MGSEGVSVAEFRGQIEKADAAERALRVVRNFLGKNLRVQGLDTCAELVLLTGWRL